MSDHWLALGAGQLIAGHYTLERILGTGVHGAAYLASHRFLGRVAFKVFTGMGNEAALTQEAHLLSQVNHPGIIRIFDAGITKTEDHTFAYLTMEYLPLGSLASHLQNVGRLPISEALAVAEQLLMAISHLGALDPPVVHRDIIPENILLASLEPLTVKISDFALARAFSPAVGMTPLEESVIAFLPPEAALGYFPAAGDLFAVGVILYLMLTGNFPFPTPRQDNAFCTRDMLALRRTFPSPPSSHRQSIAPGIDGLVLRALAPNPEERFADADAFVRAVRDARAWTLD